MRLTNCPMCGEALDVSGWLVRTYRCLGAPCRCPKCHNPGVPVKTSADMDGLIGGLVGIGLEELYGPFQLRCEACDHVYSTPDREANVQQTVESFVGSIFDFFAGEGASTEDYGRQFAEEIPLTDCYTALGVDSDASDATIRSAFRAKCKTFHPDRLSGVAPEIVKLASQEFSRVKGAYDRIAKERGL